MAHTVHMAQKQKEYVAHICAFLAHIKNTTTALGL